jgi:UDP-N-acetyl-D-glucosamine/UDP-N-acetyl-D-galactosamine dehydrogenase
VVNRAEAIGVVGLGYVGLPVAIAFARKGFAVTGFDIDQQRIAALETGHDWTGEVASSELRSSSLKLTSDPRDLEESSFYIVTVPTPIDASNRPDLHVLLTACEVIGPRLSRGDVVVFESTVFPGATEEICAPALERSSGLSCGSDFKLGYSPERINPGDRDHPLERIVKVISAQDDATLDRMAFVYGSIVVAGLHRAPSIKVAEAAKVIENTQRDVNIALMNELSKICHLIGIRTIDVLRAARTKWNFLDFHPGLVGGHCIGVDPYYLTAKAEALGYHPEVILSGRRINDSMGAYVARQAIQRLAARDRSIRHARVGLLGLTFKENIPDIRNSKTVDIFNELRRFSVTPIVHDPLADPEQVQREYTISLSQLAAFSNMDLVILAVAHRAYDDLLADQICGMVAEGAILIDVKGRLNPGQVRNDISYWSL